MRSSEWVKMFYNMRRVSSKQWNNRYSNRQLVCEILGCGSGRANIFCEQIGIDPDEKKINRELIYEKR